MANNAGWSDERMAAVFGAPLEVDGSARYSDKFQEGGKEGGGVSASIHARRGTWADPGNFEKPEKGVATSSSV